MSHPNPQSTYGENEIGTPMKPSERIEEIKNEISKEFLDEYGTLNNAVQAMGDAQNLFNMALLRYLDEQASQAKEL